MHLHPPFPEFQRLADGATLVPVYAELLFDTETAVSAYQKLARPPFGFRRNASKLMEPDPDTQPVVRRIVELSAQGWPDRRVADEVKLDDIARGMQQAVTTEVLPWSSSTTKLYRLTEAGRVS